MRASRILPVLLVIAACGGSAQHHDDRHAAGAPNSDGGAHGNVTTGGAAAAGVGAISGDAAGPGTELPAGGGGAAGTSAGAPNAGAGGDGGDDACLALSCLGNRTFVYEPNRNWKNPGNASGKGELNEADYKPFVGESLIVEISSDSNLVTLTPVAGGTAEVGARDTNIATAAWYELGGFAGGRFIIQPGKSALQGEHTQYGSGVPIVSSTRGELHDAR
jgi:hypothetical protein